ncbi:4-hydroxy-tetrahydrodipicolinate synthase [archaeon]|nr:4-hydroxy-tetrahydrodipicolinate synthase [archaeon]
MKLKGIYCPMITPFKNDEIDQEGLEKNIAFLEKEEVTGLVPLGSAGEFSGLSIKERKEVIKTVMDTTSLPVIAGATSMRMEEALEIIAYSADMGAEAALVAPPYYFRTSQEGLFSYYSNLSSHSMLPIILYNIPVFTGNPFLPPLVKRLSELDNIIGIKDTSGDMKKFPEIVNLVPEDFSCIIGADHLLLPALVTGASGAILGSSNLVPELPVKIYRTWESDIDRAAGLQKLLMNIVRIMDTGTFPAGLKYAMNVLGLAGGDDVKAPLLNLTSEEKDIVDRLLKKMEAKK